MRLYFCSSAMAVLPILKLIENEQNGGNFKIFTVQKQLQLLFEKIYGKEKVEFIPEMPRIQHNNPIKIINAVIATQRNKKQLIKIFQNYSGMEIVFFSVAYAPAEFYAIRYLANKGNVVQHYNLVTLEGFQRGNNLRGYIIKILYALLYGIPLECYRIGMDIIPYISRKYFEKNSINSEKWNDNKYSLNKVKILEKIGFKMGRGGVLFLPHDVVSRGTVTEKEYTDKISALIQRAYEVAGIDRVAIKPHPIWNRLYGRENEITMKFPDYIISELIMDVYSTIIGYASAALIQAANQGIRVISLIDYIQAGDEKTRETYRTYLKMNSKGKIKYPKTIDEIVELIK